MYWFNNYEKIRKQLASNNWNLYDYQQKFLDAVQANKHRQYLLSSEIGTGKTITSFSKISENLSCNLVDIGSLP